MTEKERFEQIKETWLALDMNPPTPILKVAKMDIDWLIQQVEKQQEEIENLNNQINNFVTGFEDVTIMPPKETRTIIVKVDKGD